MGYCTEGVGMLDIVGFVVVYHKLDDIGKFDIRYREYLSLFENNFGDIVENLRF